MAEYIEREALYKEVTEKYHDINAGSYPFNIVAYDMAQLIKSSPTADVVEVKHGQWIRHIDDIFPADSTLECSVCHEEECIFLCGDNYCPNCGAKMDLKEGAEE